MREWSSCALVLIFLLCSGCFPYHYTKKPGVSGTVLDTTTEKPVEGAEVVLTTYSFPENKEKTETMTTMKDGSFLIPAEQDWGLYMAPLDPAPLKAKILVQMNKYKQFVKDFYINTMGPAITKFKILLDPSE